jgi:hypothetical protein
VFDSFKTVKVYCANETELNNLLHWLCRGHLSLSQATRGTYPVDVVLPDLDGMVKGVNIRGYYVSIPLDEIKPRMRRLTVAEAFHDILRP